MMKTYRWLVLGLTLHFVPLLHAAQGEAIVSVGGALTEILYALDAQASIVGVDTTSTWPATATALPKVGYQRNLSAEGVLSLNPTRLLLTDDAGPPVVLQQIAAAGVQITTIETADSDVGIVNKVRAVADAVGRAEAGEVLAAELLGQMQRLAEQVRHSDVKPAVVFLLDIGRGSPMAAGAETAADAAIRLAGGRNVFAGHQGYKPLSTEAMVRAAPDVILMTQRTLEQLGGMDAVSQLPGLALTDAGRERRIVAMDGLAMLGFGPRTPETLAELFRRLRAWQVDTR